MLNCMYEIREGGGCRNERTLDFEFCVEHLNTPRGKQHVMDVIAEGQITLPSEVEDAIKKASDIPDTDYHTDALEKMSEALDRVLEWEQHSRDRLRDLPEGLWRYKDRGGAEQVRTEVVVHERAMTATVKTLQVISKAAIQERLTSLGKAQVELMIRLLMSVVTELRLDREASDRARMILLSKFQEEANLSARVENLAVKKLEPATSGYIAPTVVTPSPDYVAPTYGERRG